jgi:pyruvoyl-dependent arginine decarboxylase (PvlArgDC)
MLLLYVSLMLFLNVAAFLAFKKLHFLRSLTQIEAEVELEMYSRAHQLLVRRDQLEVGLLKEVAETAEEQWKGDLAEYMEEYEQESRLRAKARFSRV